MLDFPAIALQCGPEVANEVVQRLIKVESSYNPFAIGVVGGRLEHQPVSLEQAQVTAKFLAEQGWNFSMGLAQVNRYNLEKYGLDYSSVFEPCSNLRAALTIYQECFQRAAKIWDDNTARLNAFSCYYSGNFTRGFKPDGRDNTSYVQRIVNVQVDDSLRGKVAPINVIPSNSPRLKTRGGASVTTAVKGQDDRRLRKLSGNAPSGHNGVKQLRGN